MTWWRRLLGLPEPGDAFYHHEDNTMDESQVRKCVELTELAVNGSWKSRLDDDVKESLINVLCGRGKESDYLTLSGVGIHLVP